MAKTHLSLSHDPTLIGAPTGFTLPVRELRPYTGAGWIVAVCGDMQTMPGLPAEPPRCGSTSTRPDGGTPMSTLMEKASEPFGLEQEVVEPGDVLDRTVDRFRETGIVLPTFAQLADPGADPRPDREALAGVGPDEAHPLNLFRVHWYNGAEPQRASSPCPEHVVLPRELTGVEAPIVVALGDRFPMIGAHKVLAAYGLPRAAARHRAGSTRRAHRAVWPSTGNYCRGGVAISRLMGCRGVAVLPEGMSRERFDWLERWVDRPGRTSSARPGTESNVKEIYDRCDELAADPDNVIFNQFAEFGNHLVHYVATGRALERVFESLRRRGRELRLRAFVSATGSAGTIGAGDYLKERYGSLIVAVEALECPTLLENGFGEHNIQGIGDKHIPLIHNVMNTDVALAVSDRATDRLGVAVRHRGRPGATSPTARRAGGGPRRARLARPLEHLQRPRRDQDGQALRPRARRRRRHGRHRRRRDVRQRARARAGAVLPRTGSTRSPPARSSASTCSARRPTTCVELTERERERIFNLGYFTWVEQQGVSLEDVRGAARPRASGRGIRRRRRRRGTS